ncbi:MAG: diguanylate cyclase [Rhodanobacter sp.]|jgi:diguanylate cyclase|nr:diguanylate cyclase [Rhodanobacter sp.]
MNRRPTPGTGHEAVEALERAEAYWSGIEALLRRLVTRLTYAAEGHAPVLDAALGRIRSEVRESVDERTLEQLLHDLTEAVRSLDDVPAPASPMLPTTEASAVLAAPELAAAGKVLLAVIDRLQLDEKTDECLDTLRQPIAAASSTAVLTQQTETLTGVVNRHCRQLAEQRVAAENLVRRVTGQLAELTRYLTKEDVDQREGSGARQELDRRLTSEIDALGSQVRQANDLNSLQEEVQSRIGAISAHMKTFRDREQTRERNWQVRADQMNQRIRELEGSAQTMENDLREQHQLATTDPLTGIANRLVFEQFMTELCQQRATDAAGGEACLLVLDIDHFKAINDRFGHAAGDRTLRIVAEQIKARLRADDLLARYGGEEFVVVIKATDAETSMVVADMLRTGIEKLSFRGQQQPVRVTLSCGATLLRADDTPDSVFERADRALYQAKRGGRNRCEML